MTAKAHRAGTLSEAVLLAIGAHGVARAYPKNTVIVSEGDKTDSLYIVLQGRVKVYVSDDRGHEVVLATEGPGEYFGELVLDEGPRSASSSRSASSARSRSACRPSTSVSSR